MPAARALQPATDETIACREKARIDAAASATGLPRASTSTSAALCKHAPLIGDAGIEIKRGRVNLRRRSDQSTGSPLVLMLRGQRTDDREEQATADRIRGWIDPCGTRTHASDPARSEIEGDRSAAGRRCIGLQDADHHDRRAVFLGNQSAGCLEIMPLIPSDRLEGHLERRTPVVLPLADGEQRSARREADRERRRKHQSRRRAKRADREDRRCDQKRDEKDGWSVRPEDTENTTGQQSAGWQSDRHTHDGPQCKNWGARLSRSHEDHERHEELLFKELRVLRAFVKSCRW
jgi:hypothetical protein